MSTATPSRSRLPQVGTTIFTVMSTLAQQHQSVNLGQGFPDFGCDPRLLDGVNEAMREGANQYAPMPGLPALREAIVDKIAQVHGHRYDADREVTVTAGATQAILTAILAATLPGDDVIIIEPCYDSYAPNIAMAGARAVSVAMTAAFRIDWDAVAAAVTPRTRAIIVNSPHNPGSTVLRGEDLDALAALAERHDLTVISDEVYEHMVYDGEPHRSLSGDARLAPRSFVISSFGKTFHVTGWKIGYCVAPAALTAEFRKHHQYAVFSVNTPMQAGIARYLRDPAPWQTLADFYQAKRDRFRRGLAATRFRLLPSEGSYFQAVDYSAISEQGELDFARWLTEHAGVAAVPMSAFYSHPREARLIRFCFAKRDETLDLALERLRGC